MKKTNLTRSLLAACSIVALSAVMYGCSSSGEDEERSRATMAEEMLAALAAAAGLPDGTALTPEHIQQAAQALADSQAEVAHLTGELDTANDRVVELLADLATANANIADLTQDLADANAEVTRLEGELSDANDEVTRLTGELSTANANVTRLTGELATANAENSRLTDELGMANMQIAGLMDDLAMANSQIESLGDDLAQVTSERDDARQDLAQAQADLAAARMQNTMDAATIAGLEDRVSALEGQVEMKDMQIATMTGQIGDLNNTIDGLNNTIAGLNSQIDDLNAQIGDKNTEIADLKTEIQNKNTEIGGLNTQISNKDTEISNKNTEISNKNAEIASLETQIANKNTEINGLEDDIDDLNDDIDDLKSQIASKDGVIKDLENRLEAALALTGGEQDDFRARQIGMVISPYDVDDAADPPTQSPEDHDEAPAFLEARAEDTTTTPTTPARTANDQIMAHVEVAANGDHMIDEDEDDDTASGYKPVGSPPSLGGDWRGRILEEEMPGGITNHIVVWSNIEASTSESFKTAYGSLPDARQTLADWAAANPGLQGDAATTAYQQYIARFDRMVTTAAFEGQRGPGVANYDNAPTIADDGADATIHAESAGAFWGLAMASGFPSADSNNNPGTMNYHGPGQDNPANWGPNGIDDDGGGDDLTSADANYVSGGQMVSGSFDGVSGTFECLSTEGCQVIHTNTGGLRSVALNDTGVAQAASANWKFTANNAEATVRTRRGDDDYMTFGFWLLKPDVAEGEHEFATFFAGREPLTANPTVTGNAKYEGPAAGKYSTRPRGTTDGTFGVFRTDAALEADFDDDMVSGTISNFIGEDGSSLGDWNVVLKGAGIATEAPIVDGAIAQVDAVGGAADGRNWETGAWSGQFYDNDHVYTDDNAVSFAYPGSVAGEFHARWGNPVHAATETVGFVGVAGAFGASFTEQDND